MKSIFEITNEIRNNMGLIGEANYNLFTYDKIVRTDDPEFALELYESEGAFGISAGDQWSLNAQRNEILLGYKYVDFPVDIYHLYNTRNRLIFHEFLAENIHSDYSRFLELNNLTNEGLGHFEEYYTLCPELIEPNGFRVDIIRSLAELSILKLQYKFDEYAYRCRELMEAIESVIKAHTGIVPEPEQRYLNLMAYNPNPRLRR